MSKKQEHIEFFESLSERDLPQALSKMSEANLEAMKDYMEGILEKERAGLDRLFESMSPTMKYIPNFLLVALTKKFIDAPIAARITEKLQMKQAVSVAGGLSSDYVAQVAFYLEADLAAELLQALPKKFAKEVLAELANTHPLCLLDILSHANTKTYKLVEDTRFVASLDEDKMSQHRLEVFQRFKTIMC